DGCHHAARETGGTAAVPTSENRKTEGLECLFVSPHVSMSYCRVKMTLCQMQREQKLLSHTVGDWYPVVLFEKQYVGFATLPNQVHRKSVKKGFDFTLMVAGESGMGKSTLVNSLFLTDLYKDRKLLNAEDIEEKGVKLKLTIVDTPGFGDAVNNNECWKPITDYIDQQFEQYFRDESGLNRKNIQDNRVHCCLYFIPPFGHGYTYKCSIYIYADPNRRKRKLDSGFLFAACVPWTWSS
ncbi:Septin-5, partial [Goodea atripinnis]